MLLGLTMNKFYHVNLLCRGEIFTCVHVSHRESVAKIVPEKARICVSVLRWLPLFSH
jgi:hypothetical protein